MKEVSLPFGLCGGSHVLHVLRDLVFHQKVTPSQSSKKFRPRYFDEAETKPSSASWMREWGRTGLFCLRCVNVGECSAVQRGATWDDSHVSYAPSFQLSETLPAESIPPSLDPAFQSY